nr:PREDICTED: actin-binding protein anillin-like [Bemisia tabaci]
MDSFTERMMERAKARKDRLKNQLKITDGLRIGIQPNVSPLKEPNFTNAVDSEPCTRKFMNDTKSPHYVHSHDTSSSSDAAVDGVDENAPFLGSKKTEESSSLSTGVNLVSSKNRLKERSPFRAQVDFTATDIQKPDSKYFFSRQGGKSTFNVDVSVQSPQKTSALSSDMTAADPETHCIIRPGEEVTIEADPQDIEEAETTHSDLTRQDAKMRLKKLGALYGDRPSRVSSPIQQTEELFAAEEVKKTSGKSIARSARLAALASQINQWEDDVKNVPTSSVKVVSRKGKDETPRFQHSVTFQSPKKAGLSHKARFSSIAPHQFIKSNYQSGGISMMARAQKSVLKNKPAEELLVDGFFSSDGSVPVRWDVEFKSPVEEIPGEPSLSQARSPATPEIRKNPLQKYSPNRTSPTKQLSPQKTAWPQPFSSPRLKNPSQFSPVTSHTSPSKSASYSPNKTSPMKQINPQKTTWLQPFSQLSSTNPSESCPVTSHTSPLKSASPRRINLLSPKRPSKNTPNPGFVLQKAIAYEQAVSPTKNIVQDPAELSLAERKALFEKNNSKPILPKVPFGQPLPVNNKRTNTHIMEACATSTMKVNNLPWSLKQEVIVNSTKKGNNLPYSPIKDKLPANMTMETDDSSNSSKKNPVHLAEPGKVSKLQSRLAVFESKEKILCEKKYDDERGKELEMLCNRWEKFKYIKGSTVKEKVVSPKVNKCFVTTVHPKKRPSLPISDSPSTPEQPPNSQSPVRCPISPENEVKEGKEIKPRVWMPNVSPIVVSPPKPGQLYPSLSDIEAKTGSEVADEKNDASMDSQGQNDSDYTVSSSDGTTSFGREIIHMANEKILIGSNRKRSSSSSDISGYDQKAVNSVDNFLEEALSDESSCPSPTKQPRNGHAMAQLDSSPASHIRFSKEEKNPVCLPLLHTVSFYRKLQNQNSSLSETPVKKFVHQSTSSDFPSSGRSDAEAERGHVEKKIIELQQRISTQQTVISQATQALNLCFHTVEFSDSAEQVEAERLLLFATHRRQAALNELQRLKIERSLRPNVVDSCYLKERGSLTVSEITLPIKMDAIKSASREEKCHNFVCLLKCDEHVLGTSLVTAAGKSLLQNSRGAMYLRFPDKLTFPELYSDFKITLEVYDLIARSKEVLPHDIKYHISNKKETHKLRITPKKHKVDSRLIRPPVQSPAGPSAVRTSSFSIVGYAVFSLREIQRNQFTLNKVTYISPLEGVVQLKISCELSPSIEYHGFLTMFEDVSGFGAWHRRWCALEGDKISYWKYPDDETTKVPIDTIDLNSCTTNTVNVVSRDICARPNTFLLETIRPTEEDDTDSLALVRYPTHTLVRHLLSADTKEERIEWCDILNKALAILRAWGRK